MDLSKRSWLFQADSLFLLRHFAGSHLVSSLWGNSSAAYLKSPCAFLSCVTLSGLCVLQVRAKLRVWGSQSTKGTQISSLTWRGWEFPICLENILLQPSKPLGLLHVLFGMAVSLSVIPSSAVTEDDRRSTHQSSTKNWDVAQTYEPRTVETETGGLPAVWGNPGKKTSEY